MLSFRVGGEEAVFMLKTDYHHKHNADVLKFEVTGGCSTGDYVRRIANDRMTSEQATASVRAASTVVAKPDSFFEVN